MADLLTSPAGAGVHPASWYAATATPLPVLPVLRGEHRADVVVVGGGYTGLAAALTLAEAGRRVMLLEAHRVGWGASGRNGGQLCTGMRLDQDELEARFGRTVARQLWDLAETAKQRVHDLARRHGIAYAYRPGVLHVAHQRRYVDGYRRYADKLRVDYGYDPICFVDRDELATLLAAPNYHGGTLDRGAGHLHPLELARGLARAALAAGTDLFETSRVEGFQPGPRGGVRVRTHAGRIDAEQLILAVNGYVDGLAPELGERVMPINAFMVATAPLGAERAHALIPADAAVADSRFVVNYFRRSHDHRLLFGGGETYGYGVPADIGAFVRPHLERVFPQLQGVPLTHGWGGTLAITRSRLPYVARLGSGVFTVGGYSGQGVALAVLAGELTAQAAIGQSDGFDRLARLETGRFPGGRWARSPLLALAMTAAALRDRL